jgi:hypothetical protein
VNFSMQEFKGLVMWIMRSDWSSWVIQGVTGYSWEEDMGMVMGSETEGQRFLGRERERDRMRGVYRVIYHRCESFHGPILGYGSLSVSRTYRSTCLVYKLYYYIIN